MTEHPLFESEPIGNFFYLHVAIFEIPKKVVYNKTTCLLRQICYVFQYKYISCYSGLV